MTDENDSFGTPESRDRDARMVGHEAKVDTFKAEAEGAHAIIAVERAEVLKLRAERDALKAENKRLRERLENLLIREKDVNRALILFRTSNNAHGFINYHSLTSRIDALPKVAQNELAGIMFAVAYGIDADEVIQRAAALKGDSHD